MLTVKRLFAIAILIIIINNCTSAFQENDYNKFVSVFVSELINHNTSDFKKNFKSEVVIEGFGETSYTLTSLDDYNDYTKMKGYLYLALFDKTATKKIFGYDLLSFSDAYQKQKKMRTGKDKNLYYLSVTVEKYNYNFMFEKNANKFKLWGLKIEEKFYNQ